MMDNEIKNQDLGGRVTKNNKSNYWFYISSIVCVIVAMAAIYQFLHFRNVGPDIKITAMKYYAPEVLTPKLGDYVGYKITITNIGNEIFRGPFKVRSWLNGDSLRWEGYGETPVLAPGETYTGKQYSYTRFTKIGANYIKLKVDADNEVVESREDNNEATIVVDIPRRDDTKE